MIITKLQGGLGNQLFQWAAGKSLSIDLNLPYYLDNQFYFSNGPEIKRPLDITKLSNIQDLNFVGLINDRRFYHFRDSFNYLNFSNNINSLLARDNKPNIFLDGYWQSEKYFIKNKEIVLKELKASNNIIEKLLSKYSNFKYDDAVSLHIRRTDYLTSGGFHPTMSPEYYHNALEESKSEKMVKLVFSDDIQWCRDNLKLDKVIFIDGNSNIEDMYLMSLCKNNIIANSSFSWWGAYLNGDVDKKVIAPKIWFGNHSNINTSDIIPTSWKII